MTDSPTNHAARQTRTKKSFSMSLAAGTLAEKRWLAPGISPPSMGRHIHTKMCDVDMSLGEDCEGLLRARNTDPVGSGGKPQRTLHQAL